MCTHLWDHHHSQENKHIHHTQRLRGLPDSLTALKPRVSAVLILQTKKLRLRDSDLFKVTQLSSCRNTIKSSMKMGAGSRRALRGCQGQRKP